MPPYTLGIYSVDGKEFMHCASNILRNCGFRFWRESGVGSVKWHRLLSSCLLYHFIPKTNAGTFSTGLEALFAGIFLGEKELHVSP